ncbi:hypothetical protein NHH03_22180, partial [Stieleria sp. TO1_6]|nr:hypothetical protein [Stieleria tagensis]
RLPGDGGDKGPIRDRLPGDGGDKGPIRDRLPGDDGDRTSLIDRDQRNNIDINTGDINVGNKVGVNREQNINSIRNKYNNVNQRPFDRNYWDRHGAYHNGPGWGWHAGWSSRPSSWYWQTATWATCGAWFASWNWSKPYPYNYGTNVVYRDNNVYINNQQYASASEYYEQAETIASSIPEDAAPKEEDWMPLGVFAIAQEGGADSGMMLQLAVTRDGIIAGTFYNDTADIDRPVEGSVDKKSQRAVWKFADGKNEDVMMEAGISNLTEDEANAMVHFGADDSETWLMVRLEDQGEAG